MSHKEPISKLSRDDIAKEIFKMVKDPKLSTVKIDRKNNSKSDVKYVKMRILSGRQKINDYDIQQICKTVIRGTIIINSNAAKNDNNNLIEEKKEVLKMIEEMLSLEENEDEIKSLKESEDKIIDEINKLSDSSSSNFDLTYYKPICRRCLTYLAEYGDSGWTFYNYLKDLFINKPSITKATEQLSHSEYMENKEKEKTYHKNAYKTNTTYVPPCIKESNYRPRDNSNYRPREKSNFKSHDEEEGFISLADINKKKKSNFTLDNDNFPTLGKKKINIQNSTWKVTEKVLSSETKKKVQDEKEENIFEKNNLNQLSLNSNKKVKESIDDSDKISDNKEIKESKNNIDSDYDENYEENFEEDFEDINDDDW